MPDHSSGWLSVHLDVAYSGSGWAEVYGLRTDRILAGLVQPAVKTLIESGVVSRFFFIRYRDPGAHVRLRLFCREADHDGILSVLEGARREFIGSSSRDDVVTGFRREPYNPEWDRYGGPAGVDVSEEMFEASSVFVLDSLPVLIKGDGESGLRFGHGAIGAVLLIGTMLGEEPQPTGSALLDHYERTQADRFLTGDREQDMRRDVRILAEHQDRLLDTLVSVYSALSDPERLPEPFCSAASKFLNVRQRLVHACQDGLISFNGAEPASERGALYSLASSYLHMHLNRLGIRTIHEPLVARIARHALERSRRTPAWS